MSTLSDLSRAPTTALVGVLLLTGLTLATGGGAPLGETGVRVHVTGLDSSEAPVVERSLLALRSGPPERGKLLSEVEVDAKDGRLALTPSPGHSLHLSQVERALAPAQARVVEDRAHLSDVRLVLDGKPGEGDARTLRVALERGFAPESLEVHARPERRGLFVDLRAGEEPPTLAALRLALRDTLPGMRLEDVIWSAPPASS